MRFNAGYFGACAVVLALLGTVLAGFVLSVDKETVPYTNYDYVTDVSGLFSYDETPAYVDYNPSTNYVGYTADTGTPKYTQTTMANNYRYVVEEGKTVNLDAITITNSTTNPDTYLPDTFKAGSFVPFKPYGDPSQAEVDGHHVVSMRPNEHPSAMSLSSLLDTIPNIVKYATLTLNLAYTGTMPVMIYAGNWTLTQATGAVPFDIYSPDFVFNSDNITPDRLEVNAVTYQVEAYRDNVLMWTQTADKVGLIAWYLYQSNTGSSNPNIVEAPTSLTITGTATTYPTYAYMNPNDGVTIDGSDISSSGWRAINWSNGYENDKVTFKVLLNYENNNYKNIALNVYSGTSSSSQFSIQNDVHGAHFYYNLNGSYHPEILGYWPAVQVTLYASENKIVVTPTNDTSLLTVVDEQPYSFTLSNYLPAGTIDKIVFKNYLIASDPNRTATWQITSTSVFLNTYDTVMNDPTINVKTYFPDIGDYRLNFYSFALMGTGFNINGTNFDVDRDNATVTFTYGLAPVTHKLKNIYVSTDDRHTYLTFADINKRYDLGKTTTDTISFTGYWYFSTGLYEAVDGVTSEYVWDLDGAFHADAGQCLIIFFAILGGFVVIGHVYGRVNVKALDWVIIIIAGFMAYVYFGGLIV